jgi:hypothetical protein
MKLEKWARLGERSRRWLETGVSWCCVVDFLSSEHYATKWLADVKKNLHVKYDIIISAL